MNDSKPVARPAKVKTPTVQQALPFTPFTSIIPFDSSIIPAPTCAETSIIHATLQEEVAAQDARRLLNRLSNGAERAEHASDKCQKILQDVKKLVQTNATSHFKLRKPLQHISNPSSNKPGNRPQLTPFAEAVLRSQTLAPASKQPEILDTIHVMSKPSSVVKITEKPTAAQQAQYRTVNDVQTERQVHAPPAKPVVPDHKSKGDTALRELSILLADIISSANDEAAGHARDSSAISYFTEIAGDDGPVLGLAPATQAKMDATLRRIIASERLKDVQLSSLKQIQRLCEPNIVRVTPLDIHPHVSEQEANDWHQQLMDLDSSLVAARILLRTMIGTQEELRSESLMRSIVEVLKAVSESLIPVVESRPKQDANPVFSAAMIAQEPFLVVLQDFGKALRLIISLLSNVQLDESAVSGIMYICRATLFAENAALEKDSVLGVQNFESLRRVAMEMVVKLFQSNLNQRLFIINELISSLEKLPPSKQAARQYKLPSSKPIQLVSALFMNLLHVAAVSIPPSNIESVDGQEGDILNSSDALAKSSARLRSLVSSPDTSTKAYAGHIASNLVQRASALSKSSDEPFRKLLDIFIEDFLNVLGLPGWPAAEVLLLYLFRHTLAILRDSKSTVPVRNFALEVLGRLGVGAIGLKASLLHYPSRDQGLDQLPRPLVDALHGADGATSQLILGPESVYSILLQAVHDDDDSSSQDYHMLRWAQMFLALYDKQKQHEGETDTTQLSELLTTCQSLCQLFSDRLWFDRHVAELPCSATAVTVASKLLILSTDLCKSLPDVSIGMLRTSIQSEHVTERSQALRTISTFIDSTPSVLEQQPNLLNSILPCMEDSSPMVRDAAMSLVLKCMEQQPRLGAKVYASISLRCADISASVRKRAIKVLKEVFLLQKSTDVCANICQTIAVRINDVEASVATTASQALTDILFQVPLEQDRQSDSSVARLLVHIADDAEQGDDISASLIKFFSLLPKEHTSACKRLLTTLFDGVVAPAEFDNSNQVSQALLLRTIAVLVEAEPQWLEPKQLQILEPYLNNLTDGDLPVFCMALSVLRHGISRTRGLPKDFLEGLQSVLIPSLTKLGEAEVSAVAICLAAIDTELGAKATDRLVKVQISTLKALKQNRSSTTVPANSVRKVQRLLHMAGQFGQACNFESYLSRFRAALDTPNALTVTSLCTSLFDHFAAEQQPSPVRISALTAICAVAQRSPKLFPLHRFDQVIVAREEPLIMVCLDGMLSFFQAQEQQNTTAEDATGRERLASTYVATDQDGAAAGLSQHFLPAILQLVLGSGDLALLATRLMASIVRQGLPHPKECGPTIIALETSPNEAIAEIAAAEHRTLHDKHESIIEKEYLRAMDHALKYQLTIADPCGCAGQPAVPKLHRFWAVLRAGKAKVRQKFIVSLCQRLSFDPIHADMPHLQFVRFTMENMACFDYDRVEELRMLVEQLGSVFAAIGASVAHTIDTQLSNAAIDAVGIAQSEMLSLQTLTIASQILLLIAEARAQLIRIWGSKITRRNASGKPPAKHANAVSLTERFLKNTHELSQPIPSDETKQREMCHRFMDTMNVDNEAKANSDDDELEGSEDESPRKKATTASASGTPSGRKRKSIDKQNGSTPKKRARETPRRSLSAVSKHTDDQDSDGEWP